jgi:hypothetical protein
VNKLNSLCVRPHIGLEVVDARPKQDYVATLLALALVTVLVKQLDFERLRDHLND